MNDSNRRSIDSLPPAQQERLAELLEKCLAEIEAGREPNVERLTAEEPALAQPLRDYLASLNFLHRAAAEIESSGKPNAAVGTAEKELGDYRLLREIGRGGMGVVYEAVQISLDRRVALKVLPLAGLLDPKQIARFQREARAAAQLNHPHIVPIFSVGCERGVHYYAMQFIEGQPLDLAIRELREDRANADRSHGPGRTTRNLLSTVGEAGEKSYFRTVARLGIEAAEALHHAHEFGIIHRDVKPSNLLLDQSGKLWVTDFGLARFLADADRTATGEVLGTLRYMSPEQAAGKLALVDQRTDVYSLGITLYELLTLETPFGEGDRQELLQKIATEELPSPRHARPCIPADLETIVNKAISKSREHRYATAQELADDLKRFLEGRPTLARRRTVADRAGKWVQRHRRAVWAAAGMAVVLLIAVAVAAVLILREHQKTVAALEQAEANFHQARQVVDRFASEHAERLAAMPGAESLRRELLADALSYYRQFLEKAADSPSLAADLARAHYRVGHLTEQTGDQAEALAAYDRAIELLRRLADDSPEIPDYRFDLALCLNNRGLLLNRLGRTNEAESAYREAIQVLDELPAGDRRDTDLALCHANLAMLFGTTERLSEALASYRSAIAIQEGLAERHPGSGSHTGALAISLNNLSFLASRLDPQQAIPLCHRAIALQTKLVESEPNVAVRKADLAVSYSNLGTLERQSSRFKEAQAAYEKAIDLQRQLVRQAPAVLKYRRDLAISLNNLGQFHAGQNEIQNAQGSFQEAEKLFSDLVKDSPAELNYYSDLGGTLNNLARLAEQQGHLEEAIRLYERAIERQRFAWERAPQVTRYRQFLIQQYENYARVLRAEKRPAAADRAMAACDRVKVSKPQPAKPER